MNKEFIEAIAALEKEKDISKDILVEEKQDEEEEIN